MKQFSKQTKVGGPVSPTILDGMSRYGAYFEGIRVISESAIFCNAQSLSNWEISRAFTWNSIQDYRRSRPSTFFLLSKSLLHCPMNFWPYCSIRNTLISTLSFCQLRILSLQISFWIFPTPKYMKNGLKNAKWMWGQLCMECNFALSSTHKTPDFPLGTSTQKSRQPVQVLGHGRKCRYFP